SLSPAHSIPSSLRIPLGILILFRRKNRSASTSTRWSNRNAMPHLAQLYLWRELVALAEPRSYRSARQHHARQRTRYRRGNPLSNFPMHERELPGREVAQKSEKRIIPPSFRATISDRI